MDLAGLLGVARPNWAGATSVERRRIDKIDAAEREIRADERERIVAWMQRESVEYDKLERSTGRMRSSSAAGVLSWAASEIEKGLPE